MIDKFPFLIPYFASWTMSIGIAIYAWRKSVIGAKAFAICTFAQASWTLGYIFELSSESLAAKILWDDFQWLGTLLYPLAFLVFALQYSDYEPQTIRRIRNWLMFFPIIFWLLVLTNSLHGWIRADSRLIPGDPFSALTYEFTPAVYLTVVYIYAATLGALCILVVRFFRSHRIYRTQITLIILGSVTVLVGGILTLAGVTLAHQRDLTPLTFAISNLLIAWGLFRFRLFNVVPVAREAVFEKMRDAVIVLDERSRVVDLNPAARALIAQSQEQIMGAPIARVFSQFTEIIEQYGVSSPVPHEITVVVNGESRYLSLQISPLYHHSKDLKGHIVVLHDITSRHRVEEALRISEERYRIITNLISDYAFVYWPEPDGTFRLEWLAADPYSRLTGYNAAEIPISEIFRITHPEDLERTRQDIGRTLQGQQTQSEYRLITKGGEVRWVHIHRYPIWDATHKRVTHFYGVGQDITERKHAEEALRLSEERYRLVTNLISDYANVFRVEPDGTLYLEWITEDSFTRLTGYEAREIEDMFHLVFPEDGELVRQGVKRTLQGQATEEEYRIVTKAGEVRWVNFRRNPVWDTEQGRVVRYYGVAQNITERKRAEAEEREQRTLAEALRDTAAALNSTLDLEAVLDCILQNIERVAPHDAESVLLLESGIARVARAKSSLLPTWAEAIEGFQFPLATTRTLRQVYDTGQPLVIADVQQYSGWVDVGFDRWVRGFMCVPIQTEGSVIGFITLDSATPGFFTPKMVSGLRAFADQAAIAVCNAQLYQQAQELAAVQERQRLARDLHDAVSQSLFSASLIAETLPRLWQRHPDTVWPYLSDLQRLTRGALAEMRSLLLELRPKALEESDIGTLLGHLVNALSGRAQIKVGLEVFGHQVLRSELQVAIYRIAQEALNNVVKHARATEVDVKFHNRPDLVELTITDNGRGFVESPLSSGHLGLRIMRERAQAVDAVLLIRSEPRAGTEIKLRWSPHQG